MGAWDLIEHLLDLATWLVRGWRAWFIASAAALIAGMIALRQAI
ncbi:MAG: hypothetical protein ACRDQ2_02200 [Gaiellales bacterium]